jgi:D-inositol-3-phosphate glycosyltransferase
MISYWTSPLASLGVWEAGGMNVYVLSLASALSEEGHTVDIVTRTKKRVLSVTKLNNRLRVVHIPGKISRYYSDMIPFSNKINDYINEKKLKYDVIHSHYYYSGLIGLNIKMKLGIPLVHSFHTLGALKEKSVGVSDKKRIQSEKRIILNADKIISSTILEKNDLEHYYHANPEKISVEAPGVDHHLFHPINKQTARKKLNLDNEAPIVLFVGRIDPVKGIRILIESVVELVKLHDKRLENLKVFLIGGDVKQKKFWKQKVVTESMKIIKHNNLENCVQFIGSRSHHKLPLFYSACDTMVLPSVYESFGLVLIEAMSCGAAVIASRAGGPEQIIHDNKNGRLFESGNSSELAHILTELLLNENKRNKIGKEAIRTSQDYCWDKQSRKIISIYKSLQ